MRPRPHEVKQQFVLRDLIHQKPVRGNVAFAASAIIAGQQMVTVLGRKFLPGSQKLDHLFQKPNVIPTLFDPFVIFFERSLIFRVYLKTPPRCSILPKSFAPIPELTDRKKES